MAGVDGLSKRVDKVFPSDGITYLLMAPLEGEETPYRQGNMCVCDDPRDVELMLTTQERAGKYVVYKIGLADKHL